MKVYKCEIPLKLPSLNDYVKACRGGWQGGHSMKAKTDAKIMPYLADLPRFENPIRIHWLWVEENKRRDCDNIAFGKKFILDAMQKAGKLKNDNRKFVVGFDGDDFEYGDHAKVVLTIREMKGDMQ